MSALDFLFGGQPPASVTNYGSSTQNLPQWYMDYTQGVIGKANALAAMPYTPYPGPRIAGFTPDQNNAQQAVRDAQGSFMPFIEQGGALTTQAGQGSSAGAASPYFSSAAGMSPLTAAAPYLSTASTTLPQGIQSYMDPYVDATVKRSTDLAMQNWNENLNPQIQNTFTSKGQYGSSRQQEEADRAARDLTTNVQGNANAMYSQAYQNAGNQFQGDMSRIAGLGTTVGGLTSAQQNLLANLGYESGALTGTDLTRQMQAGAQLGNLGQLGQSMQYKDIAGLDTIGQQQQALNQSNLDLGYQDFQNQLNYPRSQVDWLSQLLNGQRVPSSTTSSQTQPVTNNMQLSPSPLQQLVGISDILKGLSGGGNWKGGRIMKKAEGGLASYRPALVNRGD